MEDTATFNKIKYMKPPTIQAIDEFRNELGISERQFERFYSIPLSTISQIRLGYRELPAKFWAIVYLKIRPTYGLGYQKVLEKAPSTKNSTKKVTEMDNHGRLGRLKTK